jgi:thimet oligopeptidase
MRLTFTAMLLFGIAAPALAQPADPAGRAIDDFVAAPALNPASAAAVKATCDTYLEKAAGLQTALEQQTGPATLETTLRRYDDLMRVLQSALFDATIVDQTGATAPLRDAARACEAEVGNRLTAVSLSRPIYTRLKAVPLPSDTAARRILTRTLQAYERAGVAGDAAARARITALQEKITADGIAFDTNIANGRKTITATPAELAGLPADYLAARPPGPDGRVTISTEYPDLGPLMNYATNADVRKRLALANGNRAPENGAVLTRLLSTRDTLARELGRSDFATLALEDKMVGTPAAARAFLAKVAEAADAPARRDYARMLARLQKTDPAATMVPQWSVNHMQALLKAEDYAVDPQQVRRYFAYDKVEAGIFRLTEDLFGVQIRPWQTKLWHPDAKAFEMVEDGRVIGRFYFDTHPRDGKYNHANVVPIRFGITGRSLPVAALVTNFPAGGHKTGLMEHRDVETFLHEFGHLLHAMLSGRQDWNEANMGNVEWDFIEAPSQMLENWVWDYDTLKNFAVDENGQVIPGDLVDKMNRARSFGEAFGDKRGLALSNISLGYHSGPPPADLTAAWRTAWDQFARPPLMDGTQPQNAFGHLTGYSAFYYTYNWSKVISTDLFTAFESAGLRDRATATRYRNLVLAPGGSKPAAELVSDFLGRPYGIEAYRARVNAAN